MYLKRNAFFKITTLLFILFLLSSCAPKGVRLYGVSGPVRSSIVASALALKGKPYRGGAKGPEAFDCSGLVYYVFRQHRVSLPPPAEAQGRAGYEINRDATQPGDLVFFKTEGAFHVGIIINRDEFVHASSSRGVVIDNVGTTYWRKRLIGYRSVL